MTELTQDLASGPMGPLGILLLAVLQGLTEFLPVSSSGHLVLGRAMLGLREAGLALDVALHVGTLGAVLWAYRAEVRRLLQELFQARVRMWLWLALGSVPAAAVGLTAGDWIEQLASRPSAAGLGLLGTAAILLLGEQGRRRNAGAADLAQQSAGYGTPRWIDALLIGTAQAVAVIPGVSRSGATISAGFVRGLPPTQAARLSFLLSVPAIGGAALLKLPEAFEGGTLGVSPGLLVAAVLTSALVGGASLRFLIVILRRGAFRWFAGYCALLGSAVLLLG